MRWPKRVHTRNLCWTHCSTEKLIETDRKAEKKNPIIHCSLLHSTDQIWIGIWTNKIQVKKGTFIETVINKSDKSKGTYMTEIVHPYYRSAGAFTSLHHGGNALTWHWSKFSQYARPLYFFADGQLLLGCLLSQKSCWCVTSYKLTRLLVVWDFGLFAIEVEY